MNSNYIYASKDEAVVHLTIKFRDTDGENEDRYESFFFKLKDFLKWEEENEDAYNRLTQKYDVAVHYGQVIHNVDYIMSIYNK